MRIQNFQKMYLLVYAHILYNLRINVLQIDLFALLCLVCV